MAISSYSEGPITKGDRAAVVKDGLRRINGRQVKVVRAIAATAGFDDDRLKDLLKDLCGVESVEDIPDGRPMMDVMDVLSGRKAAGGSTGQ